MALNLGSNLSPRVTQLYLNDVNDPGAGVSVTTASVSGSIVQEYLGQVGGKLTLTQKDAATLGDPAVATLYGGIYQYVKFAAFASTLVRGAICLWVDPTAVAPANYVVTPDGAGTNIAMPAGIALNAVTKSQYGFIQIAGVAAVKFASAIKEPTPAVQDAIFISSNIQSPQLADDQNGDTITGTLLKKYIGVALQVPTASGTKLVLLDLSGRWVY